MPCVCDARHNSESFPIHSQACDEYNRVLDRRRESERQETEMMRRWEAQDKPCSGSGYAHKPHGKCPGYATDRT